MPKRLIVKDVFEKVQEFRGGAVHYVICCLPQIMAVVRRREFNLARPVLEASIHLLPEFHVVIPTANNVARPFSTIKFAAPSENTGSRCVWNLVRDFLLGVRRPLGKRIEDFIEESHCCS